MISLAVYDCIKAESFHLLYLCSSNLVEKCLCSERNINTAEYMLHVIIISNSNMMSCKKTSGCYCKNKNFRNVLTQEKR